MVHWSFILGFIGPSYSYSYCSAIILVKHFNNVFVQVLSLCSLINWVIGLSTDVFQRSLTPPKKKLWQRDLTKMKRNTPDWLCMRITNNFSSAMSFHMPHLCTAHTRRVSGSRRTHSQPLCSSQGIHNPSDSVPYVIHILRRSLEHFNFRETKEKDTLGVRSGELGSHSISRWSAMTRSAKSSLS